MPTPLTNHFLAILSSHSRDRILAHCVPVDLPLKSSLYFAGETPRYAHFLHSGMASVVTSMEDGATAEVGVAGSEAVIGALHLLGPTRNPLDCFIQLKATALRMPFAELSKLYSEPGEIRDRILEYVQMHSMITGQIAGCNRLHEAEERLARWLLMASDRAATSDLGFTQEFLAMMLGARRTTVAVIAGALQKAGMIVYTRGRVKILDRPQLEAAACQCYKLITRLHRDLYSHRWIATEKQFYPGLVLPAANGLHAAT